MIKKLNALGDRLLGVMLPKATASAADFCTTAYYRDRVGSCNYYCYRWSADRSAQYRKCDFDKTCAIVCYDCCW
ncbi:hypothetical protein [Rhizomonospora bruguierae]|uniref:hypothetical protein n=1 Tax=Rhizomonospora bruguierae TaxID=1581705 RepID=UPI001BCECA8E|nr:hypothetical protein [Micromonospora sp. NBRC 107566]